MAHPSIFDREWEVLMRSGQVRQEFDRLRRLVTTLTTERDNLKEQVSQLEAQATYRQRAAATPAPVAERAAQVPRPAPTPRPAPVAPPAPPAPRAPPPVVVEEPKEEEKNLDDSVARFSLLELD